MATTIQLLRSDIAQQRPDPGVLANGVPMVNLHESEPGLFFAARDGSLVKIGPVAIKADPPNNNPEGDLGNTQGELWLDTSGASPVLKVYAGSSWVSCFTDPGGTVTSVGLSFSSLFDVSGSPITSSGTFSASLQEQAQGTVFCAPISSSGTPIFRALEDSDIPGISATKVISGQFDSGRIPSLDTSKITSGTFSQDRIPNLNASKITTGSLSYTVGGTGITSAANPGEVLVGTGLGWSKSTITAGSNISVTNGAGSITLAVSDTPTFSSVAIKDGAGDTLTLSATSVSIPYTLNLPSSDGTNGAILTTNGSGQLTFETSLYGLAAIGGAASLTINAGGANGDVILAPTGSGVVSASSSRITNVDAPINATDATNKAYVDTIAAGIQPKAQVEAATTGNVGLSGELTIDDIPLVAGDRVLVKNQTLPEENGIYDVAVGAWSRSSDANTFSLLVGATVFVAGGTLNAGNTYLCDSTAGGTLGTDPITWVIFSSGLGTVTSVGITMPADFSISNSPVTSSGTLTVSYSNQSANTVLAGPSSGGAATPTFRALTAGDIPSSLNSHTFTGNLVCQANVDLGDNAADLISIVGSVDTSIIPTGTVDLGSPTNRWDNIYTNDLNLSNEGSSNEIDGSWGSYSIQEGEEDLYLINRRSGKRYKFLLQEV